MKRRAWSANNMPPGERSQKPGWRERYSCGLLAADGDGLGGFDRAFGWLGCSVRGGAQEAMADERRYHGCSEDQRAGDDVRDRQNYRDENWLRKRSAIAARPPCGDSEQNLHADQDVQRASAGAQRRRIRECALQRAGEAEDQIRDDYRAEQMRQETECFVAEGGAENQLNEDSGDGPTRERLNARRILRLKCGQIALPPFAGEERQADDHAEEKLSERGVRGGNRGRLEEKDRHATKQALRDHNRERDEAYAAHPAARLAHGEPDGENDGERADECCDHSMAVLEHDSADERGNESAVGQRPIGNGETGVFRGDESPGDQREKSEARRENGEAVQGRLGLVRHSKSHDSEFIVIWKAVRDGFLLPLRTALPFQFVRGDSPAPECCQSAPAVALKTKLTVFDSFGPMVTVCGSLAPYSSCHATSV